MIRVNSFFPDTLLGKLVSKFTFRIQFKKELLHKQTYTSRQFGDEFLSKRDKRVIGDMS